MREIDLSLEQFGVLRRGLSLIANSDDRLFEVGERVRVRVIHALTITHSNYSRVDSIGFLEWHGTIERFIILKADTINPIT